MKKSNPGLRLLSLVLALVLMFSITACGGSSTPAPAPATQPGSSSPEGAATEKKDIGDSLVIYTAEPDASMEILLKGFNALYPDCEVEVVYGSAGELASRIKAEAASPQADVMFSGLNAGDGNSYEQYFEKYTSSHNSELIEDCQTNNGYYNYVIVSPCCFYVNHSILKEKGVTINSYEDLLNPALKGLIVTSDPNSASAAWNNLSNILTVFGHDTDKPWDYIDKLLGNGLVITSSSSAVFTSVTNGEYAVGLTYEGGAANQVRDGATDCEIIYPTEGSGYIVTAAAIVKNCKNYDAAVAWVEYVTSADAQAAWAGELGTTRVTNASAKFDSAYIKPYDSITWKTRDIDWLVANKTSILEKWNEIYNKYNTPFGFAS